MFITRATQAIVALTVCFSLTSICHAQEVIDSSNLEEKQPRLEKLVKVAPKQLNEEEIFATASKISNEDLSHLKHPQKPMLWKIKGNGIKKASYLFGSIHVADKNIGTLHPTAEEAFVQADTVATEVNLGIINQIRLMKKMARDDNQTLNQTIGDEMYAELDRRVKEIDPSFSAAFFNKFKTWAAYLSFGFLEEQLKGGVMLDKKIEQRAKAASKKTWHLETLSQHLDGLDKLTEKEQVNLLKDSLHFQSLEKKHNYSSVQILKNLYLKGDESRMLPVLNRFNDLVGVNKALNEKFLSLLLDDRNKQMAEKTSKVLTEKPEQSHFIIAGTLHFTGDGNVVQILRKKGYIVTRQK